MSSALSTVNAMDEQKFVHTFGALYEHSPWVAQEAFAARPFSSTETLLSAFAAAVARAPHARQLKLVREHPELAARAGVDPTLTTASQAEQASAGLDRLTPAEYGRFSELNQAYSQKFSMPFVICVRRSDKAAIMDAMSRRVHNTPDEELRTALAEIDKIAALRCHDVLKTLETQA